MHGHMHCVHVYVHTDMQAHALHLLYFHFVYPHQLFLLSVELCILVFLQVCVWNVGKQAEGCQCELTVVSAVKKVRNSPAVPRSRDEVSAKQMQMEACQGPWTLLKMRNAQTISRLRRWWWNINLSSECWPRPCSSSLKPRQRFVIWVRKRFWLAFRLTSHLIKVCLAGGLTMHDQFLLWFHLRAVLHYHVSQGE